jgi:hypothetical protein
LNWDPRVNGKSPNNIDALVWAIDALNLGDISVPLSKSRVTYNEEKNADRDFKIELLDQGGAVLADYEHDEYFDALSKLGEVDPKRDTEFGYVGDGSVSVLRIRK